MNIDMIKTGITHGGTFHADDVFSAALLELIKPDIEIKRVLKVPEEISEDTILFDIGFGKFDHHQKDSEVRDNGIKYAAFGLLWREFGHHLVSVEDVRKFDKVFVQKIDDADNGGEKNLLSRSIESFNPTWEYLDMDIESLFREAVEFAFLILMKECARLNSESKAREQVEKAFEKSDKEIVVLTSFMPWKETLAPSTAKFVVHPSLRGGYTAQCVPTTSEGMNQKVPFPADWVGKDLKSEGIVFQHPGQFMIAAISEEAAIRACKKALKY